MAVDLAWCSLLCVFVLDSSLVSALSSSKFVVQPHPIQFNEEPHDWTVTRGASVSLTCNTTVVRVNGYIDEETTALPKIEWVHNDVTINSSRHFTISNYSIDTSILTITNVTLEEEGDYHCVVNEWVKPDGRDYWTKTRSRSGHVKVLAENSSALVVNSNEHVVLSCVEPSAVVPGGGVVWMKDGLILSENLIDDTGNLLLFEVSEEYSGQYQCIDQVDNTTLMYYDVIVNTTSYQTGEPYLQVGEEENHFITIRSDSDVRGCRESPINQSVSLYCQASGHLMIYWYKNGELLDLNDEGIEFNQTTGSLNVMREDACDLLGVYQCFVSDGINTVHNSTRVLPFAWPNHPGRPLLFSVDTNNNRVIVTIELQHPDHLGGLQESEIYYFLYLADSGISDKSRYLLTVDPSNTTANVDLTSEVLVYGLDSLKSIYYMKAQLVVKDTRLAGIAALPAGSPFLTINTLCDLIDFPLPTIEETCHHSITNELVHNVSWHVEGSILHYSFDEHASFWEFSTTCYYFNGTTTSQSNKYFTISRYYELVHPVNSSYCIISVGYDSLCGNYYANISLQLSSCDDIRVLPTVDSTKKQTSAKILKTLIIVIGALFLISFTTAAIVLCIYHICLLDRKKPKGDKRLLCVNM